VANFVLCSTYTGSLNVGQSRTIKRHLKIFIGRFLCANILVLDMYCANVLVATVVLPMAGSLS
jgi:hypothetical protein